MFYLVDTCSNRSCLRSGEIEVLNVTVVAADTKQLMPCVRLTLNESALFKVPLTPVRHCMTFLFISASHLEIDPPTIGSPFRPGIWRNINFVTKGSCVSVSSVCVCFVKVKVRRGVSCKGARFNQLQSWPSITLRLDFCDRQF